MFSNANQGNGHHDSDRERNAYNLAFCELGLGWFWDSGIYAELQAIVEPAGRIRSYAERYTPHLLSVYEPRFLADAIESTRARFQSVLA